MSLKVNSISKIAAQMRTNTLGGKILRGVFWTKNPNGIPVSRSICPSLLSPYGVMGGLTKEQLGEHGERVAKIIAKRVSQLTSKHKAMLISLMDEVQLEDERLAMVISGLTGKALNKAIFSVPPERLAKILSFNIITLEKTEAILQLIREKNETLYITVVPQMKPLQEKL